MTASHIISLIFIILAMPFFIAGAVGLLRFPDVYTRLHALTKVDNLAVGLTVVGLTFGAESLAAAIKIWLVYLTVLASGTTSCQLIANAAFRRGIPPRSRR